MHVAFFLALSLSPRTSLVSLKPISTEKKDFTRVLARSGCPVQEGGSAGASRQQ